jgi:hypothetical protein
MGARATVVIEGLEAVQSRLTAIGEKAEQNLQTQVERLAKDAEQAWKQATPRRTGRLQEGDRAETARLSFTLNNAIKYFDWVDRGHMTARGWRTRHGYRLAKHRRRVEGQHMTEKAIDFIRQNIREALSKFLDSV